MKKYYMESKKKARPTYNNVGRDSVVDIATRYGLDGSRIESRWRRDIPHPFRPALGSTKLLYNGCRVSFQEVKRQGCGVDHPPTSNVEVKETIELYLYSPTGVSWPVIGLNLPLALPTYNITTKG